MKHEVTLTTLDDEFTFTASDFKFDEGINENTLILFRGLDPYDCPEELRDEFRFHSKNLTAIIENPSIIEDLTISPILTQNNEE